MRVAVLGAGAWGTAVAVHAAARHRVMLWTRDPAHAQAMREERRNARYLPEARLPDEVEPAHELASVLRWVRDGEGGQDGLVVLATSVAGLRPTARALAGLAAAGADARTPVIWLCKGLERDSGLLPHQVVAAEAPGLCGGVLSGPSFAQEVAAGLPVALTVASDDERVGRVTVGALHHGAARIYRSDDVVGVEIGGALKNVMAIAAGICDGLKLGQNARAALITRGLAEIGRFGIALGAQPETFHGLTGLGDLVLTCTGDLSRNRRVGLGLAAGKPLAQVVGELGHVAEGVACAHVVHRRAGELGVDVPIVSAVHAVLEGELDAREAVLSLLSRGPKREN
ncbi:MAG: NAD(P)H-dependent glycerol-3-phosphate dehydrogenase [Gammaproteobacteria bacterium]|jgi:glycerol-3-phosphate dehydrogenase (NAD(P)+)